MKKIDIATIEAARRGPAAAKRAFERDVILAEEMKTDPPFDVRVAVVAPMEKIRSEE
jgi:hypothetical protein